MAPNSISNLMPKIDLHFHSTCSDGKLSASELASLIKAGGIKYCALTDHDSVGGVLEIKKCLRGSGVEMIPGVELTALYKDGEIHILVYDFDVADINKIIIERNNLVKCQKKEEMNVAINLFGQEGIRISDNLEPVEKKPVGFTMAMDICSQKFNQDLFLKKFGKTLAADDIFLKYQAPGKPCSVKRSGVDAYWLLRKLKGKAKDLIIAHPFLQVSVSVKPLAEKDIFSLLAMGFNGLEVYHNKLPSVQIQRLKKIVKDNNLHYTGGSDSHGRKDDLNLGLYGRNKAIPDFKLTNFESL